MVIDKYFAKKITSLILVGSMVLIASGCGQKEAPDTPVVAQETEATEEIQEEVQGESEETADETENATEDATEETDMTDIPSLRDSVAATVGCNIGAAVTESEIRDEQVWDIITTHFSTVTFGNELKPDALFNYSTDKVPGITTDMVGDKEIEVPVMNYTRAEKMLDKVLAWNEENPDRQIKVRGHVLVWHSQTPEWFFHEGYDKKADYVSKDEMNLRLEWYIKTVLTHFTGEDSKYKDMFYGWDVVNEAVSDSGGKLRTDSENPSEPLSLDRHGTNSSWWHIYQSNEFIINAFKYANKYAPADLQLYYNDYNECNAVKRSGIVELLEAIKAEEGEPGVGTRIDAMGMQGHYGMDDPSFSNVQTSIETYAKVVGNVQITELDIQASSDYNGSDESKVDEYEKLRKRYNMLYFAMKAANDNPEYNLTGITFWGTVDKYSWLQNRSDVGGGSTSGRKQCPLLFDDNYEPKPCFWVFAE